MNESDQALRESEARSTRRLVLALSIVSCRHLLTRLPEVEIHSPLFLAAAEVDRDGKVFPRPNEKPGPVAGMETSPRKIAQSRSDLPLIDEQAEVERRPDAVSVFETEQDGVLIAEPE